MRQSRSSFASDVAQALTIRDLSKRHNPEMFRATKGSGVTITTILRNNAIETRPGNKIHHLREKRSAGVHFAPNWKTRIGEDVTSRIIEFKVPPKKTHQKPLSCSVMLESYPPSTGQQ